MRSDFGSRNADPVKTYAQAKTFHILVCQDFWINTFGWAHLSNAYHPSKEIFHIIRTSACHYDHAWPASPFPWCRNLRPSVSDLEQPSDIKFGFRAMIERPLTRMSRKENMNWKDTLTFPASHYTQKFSDCSCIKIYLTFICLQIFTCYDRPALNSCRIQHQHLFITGKAKLELIEIL